MSQTSEKDLLTIEEVSQETGWPIPTIRYWIHEDTFCQSARIGRRRYVRRADLAQFIADKFNNQASAGTTPGTTRGDKAVA